MSNTVQRLKVALVDLDGQTVPAWVLATLESAGADLTVRQCNSKADLAEHAHDAELVWLFGGSRILMDGNLSVLRRCWAIVRTGSGTDNVPVDDATRRGIVVANTPAAMSDGVSDHVIALLFSLVRRVAEFDRAVRSGVFDQTRGRPLNAIRERAIGLVGFGHSARDVTRKLSGFDMKKLAYDPFVSSEILAAHGVQSVPLAALLAGSDFVSLHCPLTPATRHLIGEPELRLMKPTAILINTSRGAVIDEPALVRALAEGWIAAAGLDVFEHEPLASDNPLLRFENVVLTPHAAGLSGDGIEPRWRSSVESVLALMQRRWPPSCVNRDVKPPHVLST